MNSKKYKVGDLVTIKPDLINRYHDQLNKFRNKIGKINTIWEDNKKYHNSFALIMFNNNDGITLYVTSIDHHIELTPKTKKVYKDILSDL